jgi:hypothetical protein
MTPSEDKKLTLIIRVESGCLGPKGLDIVDDFCRLAQKEFESFYADFMHWQIVPRHDAASPEMSYYIDKKRLDSAKAAKYLALFDQDLASIETELEEKLTGLINTYLGY